MIAKKVTPLILLMVILTFTGCGTILQDKNADNKLPEQEAAIPSQEESEKPQIEIDPIEELMKHMTLEEKIGQMVVLGLEGYTMDEHTKTMIEKYQVGGFILFSHNVADADQLLALLNSLKSTNEKNKIPLFLSVDEEGGRVSRMPGEFKKFPTNRAIGKINNSELSYEIGRVLGEEIKSLGFNMNFAPVLDINSNPKNPVIGNRSLGSDAEVVSRLGIATMRGIQRSDVIPVVKHFPGHGDTSLDSHVDLPRIDHDIERLKNLELIPFIEAINNQADGVMIAHILLSKLDPENPASMSKSIITDLLRTELNFNGIVITDDLTMGAITKNYNLGDGAVKSANAGSDILLVCHGYENEIAILEALKKAAEDGTLPMERINESVYRILKLKHKYNLRDNPIGSINVANINTKIDAALDRYQNLK